MGADETYFRGFQKIERSIIEVENSKEWFESITKFKRQITRKERWEENMDFCDMVWQFPQLHNRYHADYYNTYITNKLWILIARHINWPVRKCQRKWKYFKSIFRGCIENNRTHYLERLMKYNLPNMTIFNEMRSPANKKYFPDIDKYYEEYLTIICSSLMETRADFEAMERVAVSRMKEIVYEGRMKQLKFAQECILTKEEEEKEKYKNSDKELNESA